MPNLEKLKLTGSYFEWLKPDIGKQDRLGVVLQLKQLSIRSSNINDLGFDRDQVLQRLELLSLKGCYNLNTLAPSSVSLSYLTCLKLKDCWGLINLMASSTAKSMVQLKTMKVINCDEIEQIISMEGSEEDKVMKIVFSKLIFIELVGLKNLASFCSYKECEFEFPSLEILIIRGCPKMEKFSEKRVIAPKLKDVFGVEGDKKAKWQWKGDLMPPYKRFSVIRCSDAEVIFNMNDENRVMTKPSGIFRLKILSLDWLPQLKHVWDKDPEGVMGLQLLKEMRVEDCKSLKSLFPESVVKDLTRLEVLE
ncbi:uncharacterized protein LOC124819411, partial [Vigna umbellata]|uniref:uncharacterized protein LOC124819411 n=1 Tax=Vigna umbellata TaxID=87088 RepID=UPI001F5ED099